MKRAFTVPALVLAAMLLAGCSSGMTTGTDSGGSMSEGSVGEIAPMQDGSVQDGAGGFVSGEVSERAVITTGTVSLTAGDPIGAADDAIKLVTGAGGRIDNRSEQPATETQPARATLVIRVPAEQLNTVLDKIKQLGVVNAVSLNASDVTQQKQDVEARISALQTSVDRLLVLMASAANTADLIAIESALSSRQAELDSLTAQRDYLDDQIDYSTLSVDFVSEGTVAQGDPDTFWDGLLAGWNSLLAFLGGFIVVLGVLLPWLLLLAVIAGIVLAIVLAARRSSRRRAAERSAALQAGPVADPTAAAETEDVQQ
ncbi:MAG: DUF4349 domain-containing protein [Microterricola sp.]